MLVVFNYCKLIGHSSTTHNSENFQVCSNKTQNHNPTTLDSPFQVVSNPPNVNTSVNDFSYPSSSATNGKSRFRIDFSQVLPSTSVEHFVLYALFFHTKNSLATQSRAALPLSPKMALLPPSLMWSLFFPRISTAETPRATTSSFCNQ